MEEKADNLSFIGHLEQLRWHILRSVIVIFLGAIAAFIFSDIIFDGILMAPTKVDFPTYGILCRIADLIHTESLCITELPSEFYNRSMAGQFTIHITYSLVAGLIVGFPYMFWEFWRFVKPALYLKEKKAARGTVLISSMLFFIGIFFGYFIITPLTYNFFVHYSVSDSITNEFDLNSYVGIVTNLMLVCGIMFQLPIAVYYLSKAGLIGPEAMKSKRKHAIVVIFFVAAIFTPADVFSQLLVAFPLILFYQVSIMVSTVVSKKKKLELQN